MNERDEFDDFPELRELRELHQGERMPARVRERVLRRALPPRAPSLQGGPLDAGELAGQPGAAAASASSAEPLPWGEPAAAPKPRPRRRRASILLTASAGLAAAAALVLWLGPRPARVALESEHGAPIALEARPYGGDELRALGVQPGVSEVRVVGSLVTGSLSRLPPLPPHRPIRCGYHFHLREPGASDGEGIHVEYARCKAPEGLIDDGDTCVEVTAVGLLRSDGHVDATRLTPRIITPCSLQQPAPR